MNIDRATIRRALKLERKKLRENRARDFKENRARFSAASEDAVSRVLMLEDLLEGNAGELPPPGPDDSLHLEGGGS